MSKKKTIRELGIMFVTCLAIFHACKSIYGSVHHQFYLHKQTLALKAGHAQAQEVNKELREGLSSYRSSSGIERLARERLNLAGSDEIIVRISK
ncbi:MAG: septum formation initiator family protein [Candidatus Obscuribacterales bacterium]|nr:septum formation initiator family protein [Candidatus Obscuribacterales bacterium]